MKTTTLATVLVMTAAVAAAWLAATPRASVPAQAEPEVQRVKVLSTKEPVLDLPSNHAAPPQPREVNQAAMPKAQPKPRHPPAKAQRANAAPSATEPKLDIPGGNSAAPTTHAHAGFASRARKLKHAAGAVRVIRNRAAAVPKQDAPKQPRARPGQPSLAEHFGFV